MIRDPLYQSILKGLDGHIDHDAFQRCASDLLRDAHPTLVPISGGNDAGFDGAIGTADGPFPLIVTTRKDVIGNVRANLSQYLERDYGPRRAVVATNRKLSAVQQRNIKEAARRELDVIIENIHDRDDFAGRLYRNAAWRRDLLGLTGNPPALSVFPLRGRFDSAAVLVGRDAEYRRISTHQGDLLIVGQPGSGKTYLYQELAKQGRCLFVVSDDLEQIADEIRERHPECLVVDDGHIRLELIQKLRHLRNELGAKYHLHVNCWPHHERECRSTLRLSKSEVVHLEPLSHKKILELIRACDIHGPDQLMRILVDQSQGNPGLAVILVEACQRGESHRVWTGEVFSDQLLNDSRMLATSRERSVLAAFSLGGESGMSMECVAHALDITMLDIKEIVTNLDAGGIIEECDEHTLAVYPSALRSLLVKECFFSGPSSLQSEELLKHVPSRAEAAHVLIGARQRGGFVSIQTIENIIRYLHDEGVWKHFAWADMDCARRILEFYPQHITRASPGLLHHLPSDTLSSLLNIAANESSENEGTDDPRGLISKWITGSETTEADHLERRKLLLRKATEWESGDTAGGLRMLGWALAQTISPSFQDFEFKVDGCLTFTKGHYPESDIEEMTKFWPDILNRLASAKIQAWRPVLERVESWCVPKRIECLAPLEDAQRNFIKNAGIEMVRGILTLKCVNRAVRSWAHRLSRQWDLPIDVVVDPDFETLFAGYESGKDWEVEESRIHREIKSLAKKLANNTPNDVFSTLRAMELEASSIGITTGGWDRHLLFIELAQIVEDPNLWLDILVLNRASTPCIAPFIGRLISIDSERILNTLRQLSGDKSYERLVLETLLILKTTDEELLVHALDKVSSWQSGESTWFARLAIPLERRRNLLAHPRPTVRAMFAIAEWCREPEGEIPEPLKDTWRSGIMESIYEEPFKLREILASDSVLAFEWINKRLRGELKGVADSKYEIIAASQSLTTEQRRELLLSFVMKNFDDECFHAILGENFSLFGDWLDNCIDKRLRLWPLKLGPTARWIKLAFIALDHGVTEEELADNCSPMIDIVESPASIHYETQFKEYEALLSHPEVRLHLTGTKGMKWKRANAERAREDERLEEVYGPYNTRRRLVKSRQ